jgi:hypothetical protein
MLFRSRSLRCYLGQCAFTASLADRIEPTIRYGRVYGNTGFGITYDINIQK